MRSVAVFLTIGIVGLLLSCVGLALDVLLHARDATLAAREGLVNLENPGHVLLALGGALVVVGLLGGASAAMKASPPGSAWSRGVTRRVIVGAVASIVVATAVFVARKGRHDHKSSGGHEEPGHAGQHPRPDPSAATPEQRAAALRLIDDSMAGARKYRDEAAALAEGYQPPRDPKGRALHYPNPKYAKDGKLLDPERPETLVYVQGPRGKVLVGVMYKTPPGVAAPAPGGPITLWHDHADDDAEVGKMMHVWFIRDLRLAFAERLPQEVLEQDGAK